MSLPTQIQLQAVTTIASATAGTSNDISGVTSSDWTIEVTIQQLLAASGVPAFTLVLEDSVDAFTGKIQRWALDLQTTVSTPAAFLGVSSLTYKLRKADLPNLRTGTVSAVLRSNVVYLAAVGGATPSLTYSVRMY